MFVIQAPYPALRTTSLLPNPTFGDSKGNAATLDFKRAMNGKKYSYVKSKDSRKKMLWTFILSQHKALELQAFYDAYNSEQIKVTSYDGKVYIGYFTNNPFEFEALRRAGNSPGLDTQHQIQVEFEGFEQST